MLYILYHACGECESKRQFGTRLALKEHQSAVSTSDIDNRKSALGTGHYLWQGWVPKRKYNAAGKIITPPFSKQNF